MRPRLPTALTTGRLALVRDCGLGEETAAWRVLENAGCIVTRVDQHREKRRFFQRLEFCYNPGVEAEVSAKLRSHQLESLRLCWGHDRKKRVAVFASLCDHVLWEVLLQRDKFDCDVPLIVSNHDTLRPVAQACGVRYEKFEISPSTKRDQEDREIELLRSLEIDVVVLARYMQVLTPTFCEAFEHRILNVHHSLLPSFPGPKAHSRARAAGVKLFGATAHYATAELDAGPIIAQQAAACAHSDSVADYKRKGADLERRVLADALRAHLEERVFVHGNTTIVF